MIRIKKTIFLKWLILPFISVLFSFATVKAQDTVSSAGLQFSSSTADTTQKGAKIAVLLKPVGKIDHRQEKRSLLAIFVAGLVGGFAALVMPCIFPMLPLTVSYFTKEKDKGRAIKNAIFYGLSIILIYVVLGLIITLIFGADALNNMSTSGVFNFFFFLLLVIFAASFLGAFEISLPANWANKMDQNADKDGIAAIFFMAATLSLVSFSCTGPIIGTLLVEAATTGALLGPAVGMFGFALALSLPFAVFAMFPGLMRSLPKSGGWLNSVKIVLGFLELAFSLKFLSNVDLAYHWEWFDREVFLALWIVIFAAMGYYLLGKLRFLQKSAMNTVSVPRLFLAIIVLAFTVYMVPGLWGAPLKSISAFLPPQSTQDFDLYTPTLNGDHISGDLKIPHKYATLFRAPLNFDAFFDYDEGVAYARSVGKPVLIDFTGHACVNCRKMETNVWSDKRISKRISQDYVLIQLYVDDKTELTDLEQTGPVKCKIFKTIGSKWSNLQAEMFQSNSQPFYVLLDNNGKQLMTPSGAIYDQTGYLNFLESGLKAFLKKK